MTSHKSLQRHKHQCFLLILVWPPDPLANGDPNGDCVIHVTDAYLIFEYVLFEDRMLVECTRLDSDIDGYLCESGSICGDASNAGNVNIANAIWIINFVFIDDILLQFVIQIAKIDMMETAAHMFTSEIEVV